MTGGLHILLVDDEEVIRESLRDYLGACGYAVTTAEDGRQAIAMLRERRFDLVLADVRMPAIDGLALLEYIRERDSHIPVVMMTGHGDSEMEDQADRRGASGFLLKPVRLTDLDGIIASMLPEESCE